MPPPVPAPAPASPLSMFIFIRVRPVPGPALIPSAPVVVRVVRAGVPAIVASRLGLLSPRVLRSRVPSLELIPRVLPLIRSVVSRVVRVITEALLAHGEVVSEPFPLERLLRDEPLGLGPGFRRVSRSVSRGVLLPRGLHPLAVDLNQFPFLRVPRADVALGVVVGAAAAVERVRIVERAMRSGRIVVAAPPALGPRALLVDHGHEEPHRSSSRRRPTICESSDHGNGAKSTLSDLLPAHADLAAGDTSRPVRARWVAITIGAPTCRDGTRGKGDLRGC